MRLQRVLMPGTDFESWTVLGDDHRPVERFLSYLASIEKSPNTIKAYAHDLKDWMTYLDRHGVDWRTARLEDVAGFVAWTNDCTCVASAQMYRSRGSRSTVYAAQSVWRSLGRLIDLVGGH
jgi:site-specific recombinase XerD